MSKAPYGVPYTEILDACNHMLINIPLLYGCDRGKMYQDGVADTLGCKSPVIGRAIAPGCAPMWFILQVSCKHVPRVHVPAR